MPPTYTPLPTYAQLPTYTQPPTYTKLPSPTASSADIPSGKQTPWPTYHAGSYLMEQGNRWCWLDALQDSPRYIIVDLYCNTGPPAYNSGGLFEVLRLVNDTGTYSASERGGPCTITFAFSYDSIRVTQESESSMDCGFGHNVSAEGVYILKSRARPRLGCSDADDPCGLAE
jgi:hypothetical protein